MFNHNARWVMMATLTGFLLAYSMIAGLSTAASGSDLLAVEAVDRQYDPLILPAAHLEAQKNPPISELALYRYQGGAWSPIPFQIDEVDLTGTLVMTGDGYLNFQDELVWMAWDGGDQAPLGDWPDDPFARLNPRIEIRFTDPLTPGQDAWVYLLRSPTIPRTNRTYVSWDAPSQTATAISYTLTFDYENFFGFADLTINGQGIDILDRQKIRGEIDVFFLPFNEEDLADVITRPVEFEAQGPVRLATGTGAQRLELFGRSFNSTLLVDTTALGLPLTEARTSLDLNNPAQTGLDTYFDSNTPAGVTIDGFQDAVPANPLLDWYQYSGDSVGPGGLVVIWDDIDPAGGSLENFYLDDENANDPGDGAAYGDAGVFISSPGSLISLTLAAYILPPGTEANTGGSLYSEYQNPLVISQSIQTQAPPVQVFLPMVRRP